MGKEPKSIFVTRPSVPELSDFIPYLEDIWESRWLTNNGKFHREFEQKLCDYLEVGHCSLFSNATLGLIVGLQALRITGEVITTPFSFVATTHALQWNGIKPVFCDIEPKHFNLDVKKLESLITPKTTAIMPVHVYGNPCNVEAIQEIADTYGLKVIYDAAHAFGVKLDNGESVNNYGDLSILSFHATKVFNTIEGGAIITRDPKMKQRIDSLKNFGFADEVTVVAPGINAKMNELQAAYGLLQLKLIDKEIAKRQAVAQRYRELLADVKGIKVVHDISGHRHNYAYFPILVHPKKFGKSRDDIYDFLKTKGIFTRRYFYPLISQFPTYRGLSSASKDKLPVATKIANRVLCLPMYGDLGLENVERIVNLILNR